MDELEFMQAKYQRLERESAELVLACAEQLHAEKQTAQKLTEDVGSLISAIVGMSMIARKLAGDPEMVAALAVAKVAVEKTGWTAKGVNA